MKSEKMVKFMQKSIAFIATFLVIVLLRAYFRRHLQGLDPKSIGILFYTLAVCYIVPWRIGCYMKFRKVYVEKAKFETYKLKVIHLYGF